jgi:hypothetical protein
MPRLVAQRLEAVHEHALAGDLEGEDLLDYEGLAQLREDREHVEERATVVRRQRRNRCMRRPIT